MTRAGSALVVLALALLLAIDAAVASGLLGADLSSGLYLLASLVVSLDLLDILLRAGYRRVNTVPVRALRVAPVSVPLEVGSFSPWQVRMHLRPWAIVMATHNLGEEVEEFLAAFEPYREQLWLVDDASTDETCARIRQAGFRCQRGQLNRRKPGALRELLAELPREIATVLVLDPDTRIRDEREGEIRVLERVLFEFQRSRMAALCPSIGVRRDGWLAAFQEFEYAMAFALGRKSMADRCVTSGAAIYRRDALERVLAEHSLSVYAEDLRNAILLLARGERIYYDGRLHLETDGKRTLRSWFSQRVGWFYGLLKVYSELPREILRLAQGRAFLIYQYVIYGGVLTILGHPFKLLALALLAASAVNGVDGLLGTDLVPDVAVTDPLYFSLAYFKYLLVALIALLLSASGEQRRRMLPIVPLYFFYALGHLLPITLGYLNWASVRLGGRRLYRDHYQDEVSMSGEQDQRRRSA